MGASSVPTQLQGWSYIPPPEKPHAAVGGDGVTTSGWRSLLKQACPAPVLEHSTRVQSQGMAKGHETATGRIQPDLGYQQSTP